MNITIKNLTINLGASREPRVSAPSDLIGDLFKSVLAGIESREDDQPADTKADGDNNTTSADDSVGVAIRSDDIKAYIKSGEDGQRLGQEIMEHFDLPGFVIVMILTGMARGGDLLETRRDDGRIVYSVVEQDQTVHTQTAPAEPAPATPEITAANVLAFLRSDPRYTQRTVASVAKHFGVSNGDAVEVLVDMATEDLVDHKRRRSDGISLYSAT